LRHTVLSPWFFPASHAPANKSTTVGFTSARTWREFCLAARARIPAGPAVTVYISGRCVLSLSLAAPDSVGRRRRSLFSRHRTLSWVSSTPWRTRAPSLSVAKVPLLLLLQLRPARHGCDVRTYVEANRSLTIDGNKQRRSAEAPASRSPSRRSSSIRRKRTRSASRSSAPRSATPTSPSGEAM
jgi:hypothetical protein